MILWPPTIWPFTRCEAGGGASMLTDWLQQCIAMQNSLNVQTSHAKVIRLCDYAPIITADAHFYQALPIADTQGKDWKQGVLGNVLDAIASPGSYSCGPVSGSESSQAPQMPWMSLQGILRYFLLLLLGTLGQVQTRFSAPLKTLFNRNVPQKLHSTPQNQHLATWKCFFGHFRPL